MIAQAERVRQTDARRPGQAVVNGPKPCRGVILRPKGVRDPVALAGLWNVARVVLGLRASLRPRLSHDGLSALKINPASCCRPAGAGTRRLLAARNAPPSSAACCHKFCRASPAARRAPPAGAPSPDGRDRLPGAAAW